MSNQEATRHAPAATPADRARLRHWRLPRRTGARAPERRPLFTAADGGTPLWRDGRREHADAVILATGHRPDVPYLRSLDALGGDGAPLHRGGLSRTHSLLADVGLEWQRSLFSASLCGLGRQ
ncbi:hypothetical protein [Kitasatospora sp. NPDC085879]|uniref:hypothetical protein n=1 Tax=Kitasatospora sp. NPDC085879 TaxID=3154769 RepID=UPI00341A804D